ncbi:hypothetical protein [Oryza sativa Japonica Group]|uniref:Uncharacterized protein n=1 Tax=Oryza sativa subsp. japonica TaxID=39947 RepID=Q5JKL9_ORYSJ|nr:hypothetical protein [Oryza sativa Japonica Group]
MPIWGTEGWEREALPQGFGRMRAAWLGHARWLAGQGAVEQRARRRRRGTGGDRAGARAKHWREGFKLVGGARRGEKDGEWESERTRERRWPSARLGVGSRARAHARAAHGRGGLREGEMGREGIWPTEPKGVKLDFYRGI